MNQNSEKLKYTLEDVYSTKKYKELKEKEKKENKNKK